MERGGITRWLFLGLGIFLLFTLLSNQFGDEESSTQPKGLDPKLSEAKEVGKPASCELWSKTLHANLSTRGASLTQLELLTAKYRRDGKPRDLVTTPDHPELAPLYVNLRNAGNQTKKGADDWQIQYDLVTWSISARSPKKCEFVYEDQLVRLKKTVSLTDHAYELSTTFAIENLSEKIRRHALTVSTSDFRYDREVERKMFRMNPLDTHVECISVNDQATRKRMGDFEPEDFAEAQDFPKDIINNGLWFQDPEPASVAAVSNGYFTNALAAAASPKGADPRCQLQIAERWDVSYGSRSADPSSAALYKARLAYPPQKLAPGAKAEYRFVSYLGPKERLELTAAGKNFGQLIDLGFFSWIARVLVAFLLMVYGVVQNWGVAIIVLTVTARVLLFPLSVPSIKSMMKMRELKPEIDKLNQKFKDDPQAKGLAQMELWKKHKVNPLKGCLPQMAAMPVWFALYTTLQTAVELYNIPFLWFPDLSESDPFYILPFIIGGIFFLQQKLMPMQADPAQQKMMMYFMPGMFTVFMLFLPSGLGVYMFTNSLLGIVQQQVVEASVRRSAAKRGDSGGIVETSGVEVPPPSKGKKRKKKS